MNQADLHNRLGVEIVELFRRPLEAGGNATDVLFLLESVMVVLVACIAKTEHDEIVVNRLMAGVKKRLSEKRISKERLAVCETVGEA